MTTRTTEPQPQPAPRERMTLEVARTRAVLTTEDVADLLGVRTLFERHTDATHFEVTCVLAQRSRERNGDQSRFVKRLRVGDKPRSYAQMRPDYRDMLAQVLTWRAHNINRFPISGVRATHPRVHSALAGEDTSRCQWCEESGR